MGGVGDAFGRGAGREGAAASTSIVAASMVSAWLVGDVPSWVMPALLTILDGDERRRAASFSRDEARRRFVIAHGVLRLIVAGHLGAPPSELTWQTGPNGKPELAGRWTGVHANLSHSGGLCLIAVSGRRAVGADIQRHVPGLDVLGMARRYFPPAEAQAVADSADPADAFAHLWARKEAVTKAAGARLTQVLPLPTSAGGVDFEGDHYRVADIEARAGFRAAIALAGSDSFTVELNEWRP